MTRRPNILMIVTDEERASLAHPAGYSLPARERMAARGTTFRNHYAAATMCTSSRSVMYTGQHLPVTEMYDNDNMPYIRPLDPALGTIGTMLRSAGYYTTYQGKWHLSNSYVDPANPQSTVDALEPYGFSEWNDWGDIDGGAWAGLRVDPVIAGQATKWLRDRAPIVGAEQPWFMAVNFVNPHDIMSFDYGNKSAVTLPMGLAHAVVTKPPADIPVYQRRWDVDVPTNAHDDLASAAPAVREYARMLDVAFGAVPGDEHWVEGMNFYLNCLRDVDRHVDVVLDALEATGQADNTVVIFSADHGDMVGSHGLRQKGNLVYDENFHVPLIICHPDVAGGGESTAMSSAVDLAPTILEFAGVSAEVVANEHSALKGSSLVPALDGGSVREGVLTAVETVTTLDGDFWAAFGDPDVGAKVMSGELRPDWEKRGFLRGYTDERYSFGRYFAPIAPNRPTDVDSLFANNDVVLYDRVSDPDEVRNLAAEPEFRDLVATYSQKLESLISAEVGADTNAWITDRPKLLGLPRWHGDGPAPK